MTDFLVQVRGVGKNRFCNLAPSPTPQVDSSSNSLFQTLAVFILDYLYNLLEPPFSSLRTGGYKNNPEVLLEGFSIPIIG